MTIAANTGPGLKTAQTATYSVILAVSLCHLLNDVMQSLLSAIYPMLKEEFALDYWQIGMLTLVFQFTASLLQPVVGIYTDRHPKPWSLPFAMASTFCGLLLLALAHSYVMMVMGACMIGLGSSVFHPESARVARMASGGRYGMAQSVFQVGGNVGTAIGPLLAAFIVVPMGRGSVAWFSVLALVAILVLSWVSRWYAGIVRAAARGQVADRTLPLPRRRVAVALVVLAFLMFSKAAYMAALGNYYTFYLIENFGLSTQQSQIMLFVFLAAAAVGTVFGGPFGDRLGHVTVMWVSILGVLPLTLLLPHVGLVGTGVLTVLIGLVMAASFPAIVVFAQNLLPGRIGMVSGVFYGLSFGMAGLTAAGLGVMGDHLGIVRVFEICGWLPALGLLTVFLPRRSEWARVG